MSTDNVSKPDYLRDLAAQLKRAAKRTPRHAVYPAQPLKNGAQLALKLEDAGTAPYYKLRIARRGLSPLNDFSLNAAKRLRAWRTECKTFFEKFGIPEETPFADGAQELIYFVDVVWPVELTPLEAQPTPA